MQGRLPMDILLNQKYTPHLGQLSYYIYSLANPIEINGPQKTYDDLLLRSAI
jgi:hypothetical protein